MVRAEKSTLRGAYNPTRRRAHHGVARNLGGSQTNGVMAAVAAGIQAKGCRVNQEMGALAEFRSAAVAAVGCVRGRRGWTRTSDGWGGEEFAFSDGRENVSGSAGGWVRRRWKNTPGLGEKEIVGGGEEGRRASPTEEFAAQILIGRG